MLGLRLSWEDEREKHNSWKRPRACGTLRFHELCYSLSSSHESRKPNIHFLYEKHMCKKYNAWCRPFQRLHRLLCQRFGDATDTLMLSSRCKGPLLLTWKEDNELLTLYYQRHQSAESG